MMMALVHFLKILISIINWNRKEKLFVQKSEHHSLIEQLDRNTVRKYCGLVGLYDSGAKCVLSISPY